MSGQTVTVRLFATLKDRAGAPSVAVTVGTPATVADLQRALATAFPPLAAAIPTALVAVNHDFAFPDTAVQAGDEVALFPPVSGGDHPSPHPTYFALAADPPDVNAIVAHLTRPDVGAVVVFSGAVRGQTARAGMPEETLHLEYEAYSGMAEQKMAQIAQEIWQRWPQVKGVAIVQRIGQLGVGDATTLVACAAGHRDQGAFEAARYGIDRLKEIVPVWKKEVGPDASVWIEGTYRPAPEDNQS